MESVTWEQAFHRKTGAIISSSQGLLTFVILGIEFGNQVIEISRMNAFVGFWTCPFFMGAWISLAAASMFHLVFFVVSKPSMPMIIDKSFLFNRLLLYNSLLRYNNVGISVPFCFCCYCFDRIGFVLSTSSYTMFFLGLLQR